MKAVGAFAVVLLVLAAVAQEGSALCELPEEPGIVHYDPNKPQYREGEAITIIFEHPAQPSIQFRICQLSQWVAIMV